MLSIGIVGHEAAKFTKHGEIEAKLRIYKILAGKDCRLISGGCHLGGIDIWAEEIAKSLDIPTKIFYPADRAWLTGYRPRNIKIARNSDIVYCIVVDKYSKDYAQKSFDGRCYHCKTNKHKKSGGCWTAHKAMEFGNKAEWIVIKQ